MPKFNRPVVILQLFILLILTAGIGVGIFLIKSGNLKIFSKAGNDQTRIEFLNNSGSQITSTSSPEVKLKLTYAASGVNTFSVGINVSGIIHYGYEDPDPNCSTSAVYAVGGAPLPSPGSGGTGANLYVDPNSAGLSTAVTVVATADPQCSANIRSSFAGGLGNCRGGCGDGGVKDGCTCGGGNPKDNKSCWWRWTCSATTAGSYTATFGRVLLSIPASDADAALAEMQRMGMKVIRVWAADKNIDDAEAARRLGSFLDKANSFGISVIVSMIDFYNSGFNPQGTGVYYTGRYNGIGLLGQEFFAGGYSGRYKDFVRVVVEANKDKNNIYAWEPGNELEYRDNSQSFISFMKDITGYIKELDPVQKVATGMLSASHTGLLPQDLYSQLPAVDIVTVHTYDGDRNGVPDLNWAKSNNKSVVVEEFGFNGTGDRSTGIRNDLNFWKDQGVSAVLQWGFIAKGLPDNGNGDGSSGMDTIWHTDYDSLAAVFQDYRQTGGAFPVSFRVANSQAELAGAPEQDFNMNGKMIDWMLTGGNGIRSVYAQFKVNGEWQTPVSANISLLAPFTTQFRLAENPADLSRAPWQIYNREGVRVDYDFLTPGQKFIFAQFKDSNNTVSCGSQSYCSTQITVLEPEAASSVVSSPSASPTPVLTPTPTPATLSSPIPNPTSTPTTVSTQTPVSTPSPTPTPAPPVRRTQTFTLPPTPTPAESSQPVVSATDRPQTNSVTAFELIRQRNAENSRRTTKPWPTVEAGPSQGSGEIDDRLVRKIPIVGGVLDYLLESVTNAWDFWKNL